MAIHQTLNNMADRTSAGLFGMIFELLAKNPTDEHKEIAKEILGKAGDYDFSNYQMDADDALIKLGLAKKAVHPKYPDEGETIIYYNDNFF
jgi:hypothetical protein